MAFEIQWSPNAASSRDVLLETIPRFDQGIVGLNWALTRKPYLFEKIPGTPTRCIPLGPFIPPGSVVIVRVYFRIVNKGLVEILWIETRSQTD
jgi:hypothetical protein